VRSVWSTRKTKVRTCDRAWREGRGGWGLVTMRPVGEYLSLKIRFSKLGEGSNDTGSQFLKLVCSVPVARSHT
jgi:hypothetical protein